jgi:hypothetical protein
MIPPPSTPTRAAIEGLAAGDEFERRQRAILPWEEYPVGTKAMALMGGYWTRIERGWQWMGGSIFPRPGADAFDVVLPPARAASGEADRG